MARDCTIKATNLTKVYGTASRLLAQLLDNNTPLAGKPMVIHINGVDYRRTTDEYGYVSLNINLLPGNYSTDIKFNGDATYNPVTKNIVVKVLRNDVPQETVKGEGTYFEVNQIPLNVIMSDGFSTTMGTDTKETALLMQSSTLNAPTFYFNQGDHGVEFDISIVMKETYFYNNLMVADHLNMFNKNNTVVSVVTDAMDVPNSKYIMTIKSKKQTSKYHSIWKLHFHQFYENQLSFENMYTDKISTLSPQAQILIKYNKIDENSPKEAILALQQQLQWQGCWVDTVYKHNKDGTWEAVLVDSPEGPVYKVREPNGVWDSQMVNDIHSFQITHGLGNNKNGVCDRDTILALTTDEREQGWYDARDIWGD